MADLNTIVDQLSALTVMEAADLVKKLTDEVNKTVPFARVHLTEESPVLCPPAP